MQKITRHQTLRRFLASTMVGALGLFTIGTQALAQSTNPTAPTNLMASASSSSTVNLSWTAASDTNFSPSQLSYLVFRGGNQIASTTAGTTNFTDTGLNASTTYTYTVSAMDPSNSISDQSTSTSVTTLANSTSTSSSSLPSIPTGLAASSTTASSVTLTWNASSESGSGSTTPTISYILYRDGNQVATTSATTFTDSNLSASTTYSYTVAALDSNNNNSGQSAALSVTTMPSSGGTGTTTPSTLPAPINFMASSTSSSSITLTWNDGTASTSSSTVTGYDIIRNGQVVATTTATTFTDTNLSAGTTYAYNVGAFDSSGSTSPWSTTLFASTQPNTSGGGGSGTSTLPTINTFGWAVIPLSLYNQLFASSTGTSTTPSSPFTYINGYPTLNGNYLDCNGNIDNDPAHHTTNSSDTDPAHHIGQNCPGGMPMLPTNSNFSNMLPNNGTGQSWIFNVGSDNGQITQWVGLPLDSKTLQILYSAAANGQISSSMLF